VGIVEFKPKTAAMAFPKLLDENAQDQRRLAMNKNVAEFDLEFEGSNNRR
jgi:hypothetical protein